MAGSGEPTQMANPATCVANAPRSARDIAECLTLDPRVHGAPGAVFCRTGARTSVHPGLGQLNTIADDLVLIRINLS